MNIGVDLGGTSTKVGLVHNGKILYRTEIPTAKSQKAIIKNILESIEAVKKAKITGIGIGSPGPIDHGKGMILDPVNLSLRNVPIKKIVERRFQVKASLGNDANCFALGEALYGAGRGYSNVIGITLGTGIGGGIIIDKKIYRGRGNAAEIGHMTIDFRGMKSNCGNRGCIEEHAAARGILSRSKGLNVNTTLELFELAKKSNKRAKKVFSDIGEFLGIGIVNLMYAFDPEVIVLGGKISEAWEFFEQSMHATIQKRYFSKPCKLVRTKLGRDAGIIGAASLIEMK